MIEVMMNPGKMGLGVLLALWFAFSWEPGVAAKAPRKHTRVPTALQFWISKLRGQYHETHAGPRRVRVVRASTFDFGPRCPGRLRRRLPTLQFVGRELRLRLTPHRPTRFGHMDIRIVKLKPGQDVSRLYRQAKKANRGIHYLPDGCVTGKSGQAVIQVGPWLFDLNIHCRSASFFDLEINDFLKFLATTLPGMSLPSHIVYSPCGDIRIEFLSIQEIERRAARRFRLFGRWFPDARVRARPHAP